MSFRARFTVHAETNLAEEIAFVTTSAAAPIAADFPLDDGTGTGEANAVFAERFNLAPEETEVIDLGGVTDELGQALRFTAVKFLVAKAAAANAAAATLKPNGTHPWVAPFGSSSDTLKIAAAGGVVTLVNAGGAGWAVSEDSADKLLLSNPSLTESLVVDVLIVGVGAFT